MIEKRLIRLRAFLRERSVKGILLRKPENLRYFSGFTGGEGALVVTADTAVLWTDSRYTEQAAGESGAWYAVKNHEGSLAAAVAETIRTAHVAILAYETDFLTHSFYEAVNELGELTWEGVDTALLRAVKESHELTATRKACTIADKAFAELLPYIKAGVTEKALAAELESRMLLLGSEGKSFVTIVASGRRSALPHGAASPKVIENGDFVTFDFGAVWDGYHSDMTRTVVVGRASEEQRAFYETVLTAQEIGVAAVRAGAVCRDVDAAVRQYFEERGVAAYFTHSLGHGTGLEVHEQPVLSPRSQGTLEENMIVTVEPGLYIEGKYGVRIEDSVVVTAQGCEIVTKTQKKLIELV